MINNVHSMINSVIPIQIKDSVVAVTSVDLVVLKIFLVRSLEAVELDAVIQMHLDKGQIYNTQCP